MTDPPTAPTSASADALPPPPPPTSAVDGTAIDRRLAVGDTGRVPRAGDLTPRWRIGTALAWIAVVLGLAAIWNSSVQLGLSTWWLGPRAQPRPLVVRLSPFLAPVLMLLLTINQVRWLGRFGLAASGVVIAYGVGDIGRVDPIGYVEIMIGVAAAAISAASLTGTYRQGPGGAEADRPADAAAS